MAGESAEDAINEAIDDGEAPLPAKDREMLGIYREHVAALRISLAAAEARALCAEQDLRAERAANSDDRARLIAEAVTSAERALCAEARVERLEGLLREASEEFRIHREGAHCDHNTDELSARIDAALEGK